MTTLGSASARARAATGSLDAVVAACEASLAQHLDAVERRFGDVGLGVIDLPELGPEPLIAEQIGVAAVLWWCCELEKAGFLPFVEALARGVADGTLPLPIGASVHRLVPFWRERESRFDEGERRAIYEQLFGRAGDDVMQGFDVWFGLLVDLLIEIGRSERSRGLGGLQARLATLARDTGALLSNRAVGMAAFAAREIVAQIRAALELLREPEIVRALGGGEPAMLLARWGERLLHRMPEIDRGVTRAEAGAAILRWIAAGAANLDAAASEVRRGAAVVHAAERFRAASGGEA